MKRFVMIGLLALSLALAGCKDSASELYETAEFEELQNNNAQARKLYERIIEEHADSPYAAKARQRLARVKNPPTHIR